MGIFDDLFSTPKPKPLPPVTQTNTYTPNPQQTALVNPAVNTLQSYIENPPQLPGVTPFNPTQLAAQQQALATVPGINTIAGGAATGTNFLTNPDLLYASSNPYLASHIEAAIRPITQNYANTVLPNIRSEAIVNSGLGGSRQALSEGKATDALFRNIGDTTANIASAGYGQGLTALGQGISLAPQTAALQTAGANVTGAVGQQQYDLAEAERQRVIANQFLPFITAQDVIGSANAIPGGGTAKTTVTGAPTTQKASGLQSALGGAAAGASIGSVIPGVGTAVGAGLGALAGLFLNR